MTSFTQWIVNSLLIGHNHTGGSEKRQLIDWTPVFSRVCLSVSQSTGKCPTTNNVICQSQFLCLPSHPGPVRTCSLENPPHTFTHICYPHTNWQAGGWTSTERSSCFKCFVRNTLSSMNKVNRVNKRADFSLLNCRGMFSRKLYV